MHCHSSSGCRVANLRAISLSVPLQYWSVWPTCLSGMCEPLCLDISATEAPVHCQQISLPHLTNFKISNYYTAVAYILKCITAHRECSYEIHTIEDATTTTEHMEILSGYFQRHLNPRNEHKLQVALTKNDIFVDLSGDPTTPTYLHSHIPSLSRVRRDDLPPYMSHFYSSNLTSEKVTEVVFEIDFAMLFDRVVHFFSDFTSVTTLYLMQTTLFLFTEIDTVDEQRVNERLFPWLKTLIFLCPKEPIFRLRRLLKKFLRRRWSYGRPIELLYLGSNIGKLNLHWVFLEKFDDLKILFGLRLRDGRSRVHSYVCGSGEPDELDLREGWEDRFFRDI